MPTRFFVTAAAVLAAGYSLPAFAQEEAHCAAPTSALERMLCSDPEAADDDRAMQIAYRALLQNGAASGTGSAWTKALEADQKLFLEQREARFAMAASSPEDALQTLRVSTALRAEQLAWYTPNFRPRFPGNWGNSQGVVEFVSGNGSNFEVQINVADQMEGDWVCALEGPITLHSSIHATLDTDGGPLNFSIADGLLTISPAICDESGPAHQGSLAGKYFRIGADD